MQALVVASRFGMLLGLALWLGLATAVLLGLPVLERRLPGPDARQLGALVLRRLDLALLGAAALVWIGLGARVLIDRAAPPTSLLIPVGVMTALRLVAFVVPRAHPGRGPLLTLETCVALYSLYAVS